MKNILITILTITISIATFTQTTALAQTAPKDADAVYESIIHEYVLNEDGSVTQNYEHRL